MRERLSQSEPLPYEERVQYLKYLEELNYNIEFLKLKLSDMRSRRGNLELIVKNLKILKDLNGELSILKSQLNSLEESRADIDNILNRAISELDKFQKSFGEREELIADVQRLDFKIDGLIEMRDRYRESIDSLTIERGRALQRLEMVEDVDIEESREELYRERGVYIDLRYRCRSYMESANRLEDILSRLKIRKRDYSSVGREIEESVRERVAVESKLKDMDLTLKVVELRGYLADGEPCPVCGSSDYNLDAIDDAPLKASDVEDMESRLKILSDKLDNLKLEHRDIKRDIESLRVESLRLQRDMGGLNIEDRAICDGVDERIEELNHKISKLKDMDERLETLNSLSSIEKSIDEHQDRVDAIDRELEILKGSRDAKFSGDIESYRGELLSEQSRLIRDKDRYLRDLHSIDIELKETQLTIRDREVRVETLEGEVSRANSTIDNLNLESLDSEISEVESQLLSKNQELGEVRQIIRIDDEVILRYRETKCKLDILERDFETISILNSLIGSSDGAKFSKFAQSVTMDYLILLANRHLQIIDGRYRLEQGAIMEFIVVDSYQADERRVVSNLSGGESFLVSLALALGLSDLAGNSINIETLFLDEGFGTLDGDTLETILVGLDRLNSQGKIVGIISHVEAIKEAIPLKIEVKKSGGFGYLEPKYSLNIK